MTDHKDRLEPFREGDTFSYTSITQGYEVVWTRGADGLWHASDEAATHRGPATDSDVRESMGDDARLVRYGF